MKYLRRKNVKVVVTIDVEIFCRTHSGTSKTEVSKDASRCKQAFQVGVTKATITVVNIGRKSAGNTSKGIPGW